MVLEPIPGFDELVDREWQRLASPGATMTPAERARVAAAARGDRPDERTPEARAARTIHDRPATITEDWVAELTADGLSIERYVEVLGIVARLRAVDTTAFGLGRPPRPLPDDVSDGDSDHAPTGEFAAEAGNDGAWVPTVGPAWPPSILSALPGELAGMHDVHDTLYLSATPGGDAPSMAELGAVRDGLDRMQMEFVAARTSLINDCFF
ncbi:MAG: hypothetical protein AAF945_07590 [Actinomycetota bacterium]